MRVRHTRVECVEDVLAFMCVLRLLSYHPHLRLLTPSELPAVTTMCSVMVAQKIHDDTPLLRLGPGAIFCRGVRHSAVVLPQLLPGERPVPVERVNARMERVFLGALGFDLYVPRDNI